MLKMLGTSPGWRDGVAFQALPDTLPGWTIAYLAVAADWVPRERLCALLWPQAAAAEAQHSLRMNLHRIRGVLAAWGVPEALEAERRRVRLLLPTDVGGPGTATGAAAPYPGALLDGMTCDGFPALREWLELERTALQALWREAQLAHLARGDPASESTVDVARHLLAADPLDETALARLLEALRALGRDEEADRHYLEYRERLARELGTEPSPRIRSLASSAAVAAQPAAAVADAFVGRRLELAELSQRIAAGARLVTIVGPGGAGKSALARAFAAQSSLAAVWLDLQDLADLDAAAARLAQRLGIRLRDGQDAAEPLAAALAPAPRLLMLDNAEHLTALPAFLQRLLAAAAALQVLATSRAPLALPQEQVFRLAGLALPDDDSRDAEAAQAFDAIRLFALRAQAARADFDVARHIEAVIAIATAVDGLPLAIELAAGWVRWLAPATIARELRQTLAVLQRAPQAAGLPARPEHRSMQAVLDRTWSLLAPAEAQALEALSVFEGGFTRAGAEAVADAALPLLTTLAARGLLRVDPDGRFDMHPLVAEHARKRLAQDATRHACVRDRHCAHIAAQLEPLARNPSNTAALVAAVQGEYANACAAWSHALAAGRFEAASALAIAFKVFFDTVGRFSEGVRLLRLALAITPTAAPAQQTAATARGALALLLFRRQQLGEALAVAEEGMRLASACADRRAQVACLLIIGNVHSTRGHWPQARPAYERVLEIATADHERAEMAVALMNLGICAKKDGRRDEALDYYGRALAMERELQRHVPAVRCLNNIGVIHMEHGDWDKARDFLAEGFRLCQQHAIGALAPYLETGLGQTLYELGQYGDARRHLTHVLATLPADELPVVHLNATINLGRLSLRQGRIEDARPRFYAAARIALASETPADSLDFAMYWGEWLRDSGRRLDAARVWLAVIKDSRTDAGVRLGCEEGLATLSLTEEERSAALAALPTLESLQAEWSALPGA